MTPPMPLFETAYSIGELLYRSSLGFHQVVYMKLFLPIKHPLCHSRTPRLARHDWGAQARPIQCLQIER